MTDYITASGTGSLMIRDTGSDNGYQASLVEYWFKAGSSSDHYTGLQFQILVNGVTVNPSPVTYPTGAAWVKIYSSTVSYTQTVTFKLLTATGISGMGGPTTASHLIPRLPLAPSAPSVTNPTVDSLDIAWTPAATGGLADINYQIGYSTDSFATTPSTVLTVTGTPHTMTNLPTGNFFWFWVKTENVYGWGPWSGKTSGQTYMGAYVNVNGVWKISQPYVKDAGVWKKATTLFPRGVFGGPVGLP